jgi:hypothetical protein
VLVCCHRSEYHRHCLNQRQPINKLAGHRKYFRCAFSLFLVLIFLTESAHGQAIFGSVRTVAGVPIEGVVVRLRERFSTIDTFVTDAGGGYVLGSGLDGSYTVDPIEANGYTFTPPTTNVTVSGSSVRVDFTTPATLPTANTLQASNIFASSALLRGSVRPNGATTVAWFQYGLTTSYGSVTPAVNVSGGTNFITVGHFVGGLLNNATYHFRVVASNSFGVRYGTDQTFDTLLGIPSIVTLTPSDGSATGMRLNGRVNPNGAPASAWFELGTTTNYGELVFIQNLGSNTVFTNYSQMLAGLTPATTYHTRAVAASEFGTNYGADIIFTPVFSDIGLDITNLWSGSIIWGDYDNDERLDFLLVGATTFFVSTPPQLWRNTTNGFVLVSTASFPPVRDASAAWGDYNNDGRLDILLTGSTNGAAATALTEVYRNNGNGTFTDINAGLPGVYRGSVAWGDHDNDGRMDALLTGLRTNNSAIAQFWRNTNGGFVLGANLRTPGFSFSSVAWGDFNNAGRSDILVAGGAGATPQLATTRVFANGGGGIFQEYSFGMPGVSGLADSDGAVAWGDYNNDGLLDIVLTGSTNGEYSGALAQVWLNTTNGFTLNTNVMLTNVSDGSAAWGDYDNDGWLDILLTGVEPNFNTVAQVWRNTGTGTFVNINAGLPSTGWGQAAWGDYDNDGRLDILLTSYGIPGTRGVVLRNHFPLSNSPPSAPSGLSMTVTNAAVTLSWNAATDNETPSANLTYNVRIGTFSGGGNVLSPLSASTGFRRVPQIGNAGHRLNITLNNYSLGTPYYWSVQAVDGGFAGSPFSAQSDFKILPVSVPATAPALIPGDLNGDGKVDQSELNIVLSNYWPHSPWIEMTNVAGLGTTNVQFALTNATGWNFSVEVSTNLMNWDFLGPAFPFYQFDDPAATNEPQRYYRLRWP